MAVTLNDQGLLVATLNDQGLLVVTLNEVKGLSAVAEILRYAQNDKVYQNGKV